MKRYTFTADLKLPLGFFTGTGDYKEATDNAILTDQRDRPYLPGTSIAGILRTEMERIAPFVFGSDFIKCSRTEKKVDKKKVCQCQVCRLMGTALGGEAAEGEASQLIISNSRPADSSDFLRKIRDRVGIDRDRLTAAHGKKYDVELLEGEVIFPIEMMLEKRDVPFEYNFKKINFLCSQRTASEIHKGEQKKFDERLKLLLALMKILQHEPLFIGGHSSRGMGYAKLEDRKSVV